MNNTLRVAAVPLAVAAADKAANLAAAAEAIASLPAGTDIAVLPELFSTGLPDDEGELRRLAEPNSGDTVRFLADLARRSGVALAGSFLASTAGTLFNRAFFIEPGGDDTFYDKRHLFGNSPERRFLSPGHAGAMPVVRYRGWNVALAVCYDVRFPVWCRSRDYAYDLLLVPANWPAARAYAWEHLLIARAIENQACVVGANTPADAAGGPSYIFDALGRPAGQATTSGIIAAELSRDALDKVRRAMPVAADADPFTLNF